MSWKNRMKRKNRKMRTSLLAAGFLSCTLLTCAGGVYCMRHTAYALEQAEADAALDMVQSEDLTEGEYDELISNVVHSAVDVVSTDETETEGMLLSILPQKVKEP